MWRPFFYQRHAAAPVYTSRLQFLIMGQSNASGRGLITPATATPSDASIYLYGNDYTWKRAYEPIDDPAGQVDLVSDDSGNILASLGNGHSFALQCARGLMADGRRIDLIPCAKGGSSMSEWMPGGDRSDRATLYGSANYRRAQAIVSSVTGILYFGHENQAGDPTYATQWANLVTELRTDFGASVPIFYCQLAKHSNATSNANQHATAEVQRLQENGSGHASSITGCYLIPTFDLPLIDQIHLNDTAQRIVGDRMALAIRQRVLLEAVDGKGPRLNGAPRLPSSTTVKVDTSQTLATITGNADNQFRVFDNGVEVAISSVVRDPADASAALITLAAAITGTATVSYGNVAAAGTGITLANVVKNAAGLPLPQFGLQTVVP